MTLTDERLKLLRDPSMWPLTSGDLKALLNRLDAAEAVCHHVCSDDPGDDTAFADKVAAWNKARGVE